MFLSFIIGLVAISISIVAAYYSIVGLTAIFAAALIPIIIMGITLEVGKIATVVWLHAHWKRAPFLMKAYLVPGVITLMLITSMGIFGFLSKAHIEQTSAATESQAKVEQIIVEIQRQTAVVLRAEEKIKEIESVSTVADTSTQQQIDLEQQRIQTAYERIQPAIREQNAIIDAVTTLFQSELDKIDAELTKLQSYIDADDIAKAQGMIGAKADGNYGPMTAQAFTAFQDAKKVERSKWVQQLQDAAQSTTVVSARAEIDRLRNNVEQQIVDSNKLINRLRDQLATPLTVDDNDELMDAQYQRIGDSTAQIEILTNEQYALEAQYRKMEAEVGPIKYIAEFIYGAEAGNDKTLLEKAVRYIIIILVLVFDPMAVMLILAASSSFRWAREDRLPGQLPEQEHIEVMPQGADEFFAGMQIAQEQEPNKELLLLIEKLEYRIKTLDQVNDEKIALGHFNDKLAAYLDKLYEECLELEHTVDLQHIELEVLAEQFQEQTVNLTSKKIATLTSQWELNRADAIDNNNVTETALHTANVQRDVLAAELKATQDTLDSKQKQLATAILDLDILANSHDQLFNKNVVLSGKQINTTQTADYPIDNLGSLRNKIRLLEAKLESMHKVTDFDLAAAQELIELKQQHHELEIRMAEIVQENKVLKGVTK